MYRCMAEFIPCGLGANASFAESVSFIRKLRDGRGAQDKSRLSLFLLVQLVNRQGRTSICSVNRRVLSRKVRSPRLWMFPAQVLDVDNSTHFRGEWRIRQLLAMSEPSRL